MPTELITIGDLAQRRVGYNRVGVGRIGRLGRLGQSSLAQRRVGYNRVGMGSMGADAAPGMLDQIRTIYDGVVQLDPIIGFAGDHPYLFISLVMTVIGVGAGVGAFIGGGGVEALQDMSKKGRR